MGIERAFVSDQVSETLDRGSMVGIDGWLEPLRAVKTAEEIEVLRRLAALLSQASGRSTCGMPRTALFSRRLDDVCC
jgi:Xaa-Pro aminopeptidase